ncbi:MAG: DUF192 domain-containing protein [bacterium]
MNWKDNLKGLFDDPRLKTNFLKAVMLIISIPIILVSGLFTLNQIEKQDNPAICQNFDFLKFTSIPVTIQNDQFTYNFTLEIADSETKREQGLMCRPDLNDNSGMLFIFPIDTQASFWMKNTIIPLDIIFLNSNKQVVDIFPNAAPLRADIYYTSSQKIKYAIELKGGSISKFSITKSSKISFGN